MTYPWLTKMLDQNGKLVHHVYVGRYSLNGWRLDKTNPHWHPADWQAFFQELADGDAAGALEWSEVQRGRRTLMGVRA